MTVCSASMHCDGDCEGAIKVLMWTIELQCSLSEDCIFFTSVGAQIIHCEGVTMLDQNKMIKVDSGVMLIYMYREMCERATHQELCFECICKNMCRTLFWYVLFMF